MSSPTVKLTAYLVRAACGLEDNEVVLLEEGAETVRVMALAAQLESDRLRAEVERLREAEKESAALSQWAEDIGSKCDRYKRERDDDRIDYAKTYQERDELRARLEANDKMLREQTDYSIALQKLIEHAARGESPTEDLGQMAPHHAPMLRVLAAKAALVEAWKMIAEEFEAYEDDLYPGWDESLRGKEIAAMVETAWALDAEAGDTEGGES